MYDVKKNFICCADRLYGFEHVRMYKSKDGRKNSVKADTVVVAIGTFISTIIDFILVALVVFAIVKAMNTAKAKAEAKLKAERETKALSAK